MTGRQRNDPQSVRLLYLTKYLAFMFHGKPPGFRAMLFVNNSEETLLPFWRVSRFAPSAPVNLAFSSFAITDIMGDE